VCVQKSNYVTFSSAFSSTYAKTRTSKFRKVVQQHTEGMVGNIIMVLLEMYLAFQQWKNFENPLRSYRHEFGVLYFLGHSVVNFIKLSSYPCCACMFVRAEIANCRCAIHTTNERWFFVWFLPCDAMHKRGYCRHAVSVCPSVRPSVCLSDTFVSCAEMNKGIFEIFSPSGSQAILVFPHQMGWRYSDGTP